MDEKEAASDKVTPTGDAWINNMQRALDNAKAAINAIYGQLVDDEGKAEASIENCHLLGSLNASLAQTYALIGIFAEVKRIADTLEAVTGEDYVRHYPKEW